MAGWKEPNYCLYTFITAKPFHKMFTDCYWHIQHCACYAMRFILYTAKAWCLWDFGRWIIWILGKRYIGYWTDSEFPSRLVTRHTFSRFEKCLSQIMRESIHVFKFEVRWALRFWYWTSRDSWAVILYLLCEKTVDTKMTQMARQFLGNCNFLNSSA